jgi:hypothetical protein
MNFSSKVDPLSVLIAVHSSLFMAFFPPFPPPHRGAGGVWGATFAPLPPLPPWINISSRRRLNEYTVLGRGVGRGPSDPKKAYLKNFQSDGHILYPDKSKEGGLPLKHF